MHITDVQLHTARRHLLDACDNLLIAGYETPDGRVRNISNAKDELREAAGVLGFDLVDRATAEEAARLAGAPDWKSPLDGRFGPEFLGDTPNGTTMGFR